MYVQEENVELKRQKLVSSENYSWTDYMSLPFTQNVSPKWIIYSMFIIFHSLFFIFAKNEIDDAHVRYCYFISRW